MSAVLLCSDTGPIQMKVAPGTALVAFASEEIGQRYLSAFGYSKAGLALRDVASITSSWQPERRNDRTLYFRSLDDLVLLAKERAAFPYLDYVVGLSDVEKRG